MSRKLRMVIFWAFLGLGVGLGAPYDPKQTDDILRIMNETKIQVILDKGDGPPDGYEVESVTTQVVSDDAKLSEDRRSLWISRRGRRGKMLKLSETGGRWFA